MDLGQFDLTSPDPMGALLEQMAVADPQMRLIVEALRHRISRDASSEITPTPPSAALRAGQKESLAQMRERYVALRTTVYTLAAALGACGNCWGTDADCPVCGGEGIPDSQPPDENLYLTYVLPAVRRHNLQHRAPIKAPARDGGGSNTQEESHDHAL